MLTRVRELAILALLFGLAATQPSFSNLNRRPYSEVVVDETDINGDDSNELLEADQLAQESDEDTTQRDEADPLELETDLDWPEKSLKLGQVSGVAFDKDNVPHLVHRADRSWDASAFDENNNYKKANLGKIASNVVLKLERESGKVAEQWGANWFYMPHGLTIDSEGNTWVTDVAAHQVFKFAPASGPGPRTPALTLGEALKPGADEKHFCKPTDVAVLSNGDFFISDGYCNSRVLKFDKAGNLKKQWGRKARDEANPQPDEFFVVHGLALLEDQDMICAADREHRRIQCFNAGIKNESQTGQFKMSLSHPAIGSVFAIAFDTVHRQLLGVGVNGADGNNLGFTFDSDAQLQTWSPSELGFGSPHDIAVSSDGNSVLVGEIAETGRIWKFDRLSSIEASEAPVKLLPASLSNDLEAPFPAEMGGEPDESPEEPDSEEESIFPTEE